MSTSFFYGMESPVIYDSPEPAPEPEPEAEMQNKTKVRALYKALAHGHTHTVAGLLASDLEWWFHGPPDRNHMMRVLTGGEAEFRFEPRSVTAIGEVCVIAEGWEGHAYWVHVWTLKDGMVTQFREYFDTWLTVRVFRPSAGRDAGKCRRRRESVMTLWQSQPRDLAKRSLPGLVLAI